ARHAEATGGDLLDGAVLRVAVGLGGVAGGVLATLAGVALAADAVHGDGERLVRLLADRAIGHGARLESLHYRFDGLDLLDGHGLPAFGVEVHEAAQRAKAARLIVDELRVFLEDLEIAGAASVLELVGRLRVEEVVLAFAAVLVVAADVEGVA